MVVTGRATIAACEVDAAARTAEAGEAESREMGTAMRLIHAVLVAAEVAATGAQANDGREAAGEADEEGSVVALAAVVVVAEERKLNLMLVCCPELCLQRKIFY